MKILLYIFLGGGAGSVLRYAVSLYTASFNRTGNFPLATFTVNMLGCLLIGFFSAFFIRTESSLKYLLITGFCGGFTTYSAFASESFSLWQENSYIILTAYLISTLLGGVLAVFAGLTLGKMSF